MTEHIKGSTSSENSTGNPDDDTLGSFIGSSEDWAPVVERLAQFAPTPEKEGNPLVEALNSTNPEELSFGDLERVIQLTKRFQKAAAYVLLPIECDNPSGINLISAAGRIPFRIRKGIETKDIRGKYLIKDEHGEALFAQNPNGYKTAEEALQGAESSLITQGYRIVKK